MQIVRTFTQKGKPLVVSSTKLDHQRRQIFRRDARKALKAALKAGAR